MLHLSLDVILPSLFLKFYSFETRVPREHDSCLLILCMVYLQVLDSQLNAPLYVKELYDVKVELGIR